MNMPGFTARKASYASAWHYQNVAPFAAREMEEIVIGQLDLPNEFHGNWCGPGHSGPGVPIDAVDEACCRHDQCFCAEGYDDCACNRQAMLRMPGAVVDSSTSPHGKVVGNLIAGALAGAPCLCHEIWLLGWHEAPVPFPSVGGFCPPPFG